MIRQAKKEDAKVIAPLILVVLKDMELPILESVTETEILAILEQGIQDEQYRYSYRHTIVAEVDGKVAGVLVGYPGSKEAEIDVPLQQIAENLNISLGGPLFVEKETFSGEWYLDTFVTDEQYRGQGIGTKLIEALPEFVQQSGEHVVGLSCDQGNPKARKLYDRLGFVKTGEVVLSGHRYDHLQKEI
ncbi:GNAT family N-acetyltransferase [Isobaculum melis]|nr:GNAT family N-acetyltransferase [Isobaculum melis]